MGDFSISGPVQFYDNGEEVPAGWPSGDDENFIEIDRVYGVHYSMSDEQWELLGRIYKSLPGADRVPLSTAWFGLEDDPKGWLWVSVEPAGLQVCGRLSIRHWQEWHDAFHSAISRTDFPRIDYGYLDS